MKNVKLIAIVLMLGIMAVSCKKEKGPVGPAGPAGQAGVNGNANVTVYGYGSHTFTSGSPWSYYYPDGLTGGMIDSSTIMMYYSQYPGEWNVANGFGPGADYANIVYTSDGPPASVNVYLQNVDGGSYSGGDVTWDSVRIFVIPANIFKSTPAGKVDFNDYQSVKSYYTER